MRTQAAMATAAPLLLLPPVAVIGVSRESDFVKAGSELKGVIFARIHKVQNGLNRPFFCNYASLSSTVASNLEMLA